MKLSFSFAMLLLLIVYGCTTRQKPKQTLQEKQKELEVGKLDDNYIYTAKEVGWTAALPADWRVFTKRDNYDVIKKGKEAVEDASGTIVDDSRLVNLISIRKDISNSFQSTMEPVDTADAVDYDKHIQAIQDLIQQVYKSRGIPAEYFMGAVKIDGIWFDRLEITVYSGNKKKVILEQKFFSALINGYDFGMNINYTNDADKETLMNIVMESKFSIKE